MGGVWETNMDYVYERVLQRAAEIVGGVGELAKRLSVKESIVSAWIEGKAKPPPNRFLMAVDIVMEHDGPKGPGRGSVEFRRL